MFDGGYCHGLHGYFNEPMKICICADWIRCLQVPSGQRYTRQATPLASAMSCMLLANAK
jgi:hypothetical protein